jgi:hypothetical protein
MDDYGPVIDLTRTLGLSSGAFASAVPDTIDVDQWLQAFAVGSTCGVGDNWISNSAHNAMFYFRPTDKRVLFFLHDWTTRSIGRALESNDYQLLFRRPRAYAYGTFSIRRLQQVLAPRAFHGQLPPEQPWSGWLITSTPGRHVLSQLMAKAGLTLRDHQPPPAVASLTTPIKGHGWIDARSASSKPVRLT